MTCGDLRDLLSALADGAVSPAQREWLELHVERCPTCQERFTGYRRVRELLAVLPADAWVPPPGPAMPRRPSSRLRLGWPRARPWSVLVSLMAGLLVGGAGTLALTSRAGLAPQQLAAAPPIRATLPTAMSPSHVQGATSSAVTSTPGVRASAGARPSPSVSATKPLASRGAGGPTLVIANVSLHAGRGASHRRGAPQPKTNQPALATQPLPDPHPLSGLGFSSRGTVTAAHAI